MAWGKGALILMLCGLGSRLSRTGVASAEGPDDDFSPEDVYLDRRLKEMLLRSMAEADEDGDHKVSLQELLEFWVQTHKKVAWRRNGLVVQSLDTNEDGQLSEEEILRDMSMEWWGDGNDEEDRQLHSLVVEKELEKFRVADQDGDGQLRGPTELLAYLVPETDPAVSLLISQWALARRDSDGDGALTAEEFWEVDKGAGPPTSRELRDFQRLDADGDKRVSAAEFVPWESGRFATLQSLERLWHVGDLDRDGRLEEAEVQQTWEELRDCNGLYKLKDLLMFFWEQHE